MRAATTDLAVPQGVLRDRSGGFRAHVSRHAVRRYLQRMDYLRIAETDDDARALARAKAAGIDLGGVRERLAYYGGVAIAHGARGCRIDGALLIVERGTVVTVITGPGARSVR